MRVPREIVANTERALAEAGRQGKESVVVWLGRDEPSVVYYPAIENGPQHFAVPPSEVRRLVQHCTAAKVRILAQVHSHPERACHSKVDDRDALPHRLGALSIVLPRFAREGFAAPDWRVYQLTNQGWTEVSQQALEIASTNDCG